MERNLVHGPGDILGKPFRLSPWLKRFLLRLYSYDPTECEGVRLDGGPHRCRRVYRRALLGVPKGNSKTELMAAVALEQLAGPTAPLSPEVRIAAASFEQADLLFGAASAMVNEGPLAGRFNVFDTEILPKEQPGVLKRIAAAAGTTDGGRTTCFIADELHEWVGGKERVHLVNSNSLAKRRSGLELNISTAGFDRDSLLGKLYDHGRKIASGEVSDPRFLFEWWESVRDWNLSDEQELMAAIVEANPAVDDWLDPSRVAERFRDPDVATHEFLRYYLNRWAVAPDRWIAPDAWAALVDRRRVPAKTRITVGFDGSASRDNTALVACTVEENPHFWAAGVWERDPHDPTWRVPREAVYARLGQLFEEYDVAMVLCDPAGWTAEVEEWIALHGEAVTIFPQTNDRMAPASDQFRAMVIRGECSHDGNQVLARNVVNAVTRETRWGLSITKDHRDSPRKIDAAVAAVLADAARRLSMAPAPAPFFIPFD